MGAHPFIAENGKQPKILAHTRKNPQKRAVPRNGSLARGRSGDSSAAHFGPLRAQRLKCGFLSVSSVDSEVNSSGAYANNSRMGSPAIASGRFCRSRTSVCGSIPIARYSVPPMLSGLTPFSAGYAPALSEAP